MDKRHYSAFSGTDLDIRLRERGITELCLTGVCTDICVLHTAVDAYNLGYQLMILNAPLLVLMNKDTNGRYATLNKL